MSEPHAREMARRIRDAGTTTDVEDMSPLGFDRQVELLTVIADRLLSVATAVYRSAGHKAKDGEPLPRPKPLLQKLLEDMDLDELRLIDAEFRGLTN